jgi:hypothetical protein
MRKTVRQITLSTSLQPLPRAAPHTIKGDMKGDELFWGNDRLEAALAWAVR